MNKLMKKLIDNIEEPIQKNLVRTELTFEEHGTVRDLIFTIYNEFVSEEEKGTTFDAKTSKYVDLLYSAGEKINDGEII